MKIETQHIKLFFKETLRTPIYHYKHGEHNINTVRKQNNKRRYKPREHTFFSKNINIEKQFEKHK